MSDDKKNGNSVNLSVQPDGLHPFPYLAAARFHLHFRLDIAAAGAMPASDVVVFTFSDVFAPKSDAPQPSCRRELGNTVGAGTSASLSFTVSNDEMPLPPSLYHVKADVIRDGRSMLGANAGSAFLYLRKDNESAFHAIGSRLCGQAGFSPAGPVTGLSVYNFGLALPRAAHAFRAMGEPARADFCDKTLQSFIEEYIFGKMADEQGLFCDLKLVDGAYSRSQSAAQNSCQGAVLALTTCAARHFKSQDSSRADFARLLAEKSKPAAEYLLREPPGPGVGCGYEATGCRVYDGLALHGASEWLDVCRESDIECRPEHAAWVTLFAIRAAKKLSEGFGWYDAHCLGGSGAHAAAGNVYILAGLMSARRLVAAAPVIRGVPAYFRDSRDAVNQMDSAARPGLDFLLRECEKSAAAQMPALSASLYGVLDDLSKILAPEPRIVARMRAIEHAAAGCRADEDRPDLDRLAEAAVLLRACPEFAAAPAR